MYAVHLTFKNVKSTPVKFEYNEIIDSEHAQYKVILKGSDDQRVQIQVTTNGVQIGNNNNSTEDNYVILAANGGEQVYDYEVHLTYAKSNNSYRKKRRKD